MGLEGLVSKRRDRPYQGGRSKQLGQGEEPEASGDEPGDGGVRLDSTRPLRRARDKKNSVLRAQSRCDALDQPLPLGVRRSPRRMRTRTSSATSGASSEMRMWQDARSRTAAPAVNRLQIAIALLADTAKLVLASARWSQRWSRALPIPREPQIAPTSLALSCPLRSRPRHQQRTN